MSSVRQSPQINIASDDYEICRESWEGSIPILIQLAPDENSTNHAPDPFCMMVPRNSYFPLITDPIREYFSSYITSLSASPDEIWFDFRNIPLKWQYPIGVLFDLYALAGLDSNVNSALPWILTIHFREYPKDILLRCSADEAKVLAKSNFMNTLKEANYLKHGDIVKINSFSFVQQDNLWEGLIKGQFDTFWEVNQLLLSGSDPKSFKYVPMRVFRSLDSTVHPPLIQEPISPFNPKTGAALTLGQALLDLFPSQMVSESEMAQGVRILIEGISPPLCTPIAWLSQYMSHPDNFLYVCIVRA
eukprot:TRINITY_DN5396_c0_g1_i1.p1 TRINITY_DN5396_c0_g1~~TRINITY_DN5396_c0_g1_i1.p1  ORF type:complete len:303 (+),score=70.90 TRINITY_DN5396_c0_g1_i1:39-947(+)